MICPNDPGKLRHTYDSGRKISCEIVESAAKTFRGKEVRAYLAGQIVDRLRIRGFSGGDAAVRWKLFAIAIGIAVGLTGCSAGIQPSPTPPGPGTPPPPSAIAPAPEPRGNPAEPRKVDLQFAQHMIAHHQSGKLLIDVALKNAGYERIIHLAEQFEAQHGPQIERIKQWLAKNYESGVVPQNIGPGEGPLMPGAEISGALNDIEEAQQDQVALLWAKAMLTHHHEVVEIAKVEIEKGSSPELKKIAKEIKKTRQAEIDKLLRFLEHLAPA